jgi:hypothetical protein
MKEASLETFANKKGIVFFLFFLTRGKKPCSSNALHHMKSVTYNIGLA